MLGRIRYRENQWALGLLCKLAQTQLDISFVIREYKWIVSVICSQLLSSKRTWAAGGRESITAIMSSSKSPILDHKYIAFPSSLLGVNSATLLCNTERVYSSGDLQWFKAAVQDTQEWAINAGLVSKAHNLRSALCCGINEQTKLSNITASSFHNIPISNESHLQVCQ